MLSCPGSENEIGSQKVGSSSNTAGLLMTSHVTYQEHHTGMQSRCSLLMQHAHTHSSYS
jgi:hypothetical protein